MRSTVVTSWRCVRPVTARICGPLSPFDIHIITAVAASSPAKCRRIASTVSRTINAASGSGRGSTTFGWSSSDSGSKPGVRTARSRAASRRQRLAMLRIVWKRWCSRPTRLGHCRSPDSAAAIQTRRPYRDRTAQRSVAVLRRKACESAPLSRLALARSSIRTASIVTQTPPLAGSLCWVGDHIETAPAQRSAAVLRRKACESEPLSRLALARSSTRTASPGARGSVAWLGLWLTHRYE